MGGTSPIGRSRGDAVHLHTGTGGIVPLQNVTVLIFAIIFSLLFIIAVSFSFLGEDEDEPPFKSMLNDIAKNDPGVVLLGENVDVDVDEPSVTVSWSFVACGGGLELNGSSGVHESQCGLPAMSLWIYADNAPEPAAIYEPALIPFVLKTGKRRRIENLVRFDSDHTLDVHKARLYPFDSYLLSSTLRAVDATNTTVPIRKLSTIDRVTSFIISSTDIESYETTFNGTQVPTRDFDLCISRPGQLQFFALVLFGISWMLSHVTIGHVLLARRLVDIRSMTKHLVSAFAILLVIPQLRNSMPDSPALDDGALIDYIGFFPQMIISASSVIIILLLIMLREYDDMEGKHTPNKSMVRPLPLPAPPPPRTAKVSSKPPPPPVPPRKSPLRPLLLGAKVRTRSVAMERGEATSLKDELNASFVFPPTPHANGTIHHRSRSSRSRLSPIGLGEPPGSGSKLSRSNTLKPVKE
ncbi:hypothetical protein DEU56DRAFT_822353 [Suillus clintonianus]|uniref:uncharacterized protein n=1 Tax=Suillus clintonianus TaxID=1904413 RepID=UPI001B86F4F7|nr:uncharacterized protein DEU56DRAFT_822353 [Suillus clintonianus]KAG2126536.1 hypothetical protein DEU56DRAFT_822353 [Suillus clintonianus]